MLLYFEGLRSCMVENRMKKGGFKTVSVNILIVSFFANTFLKYIEGFSDH